MEGSAPERRRKLMTYGKSSKKQIHRKSQSQQGAPIEGPRNSFGGSSQFQLQSQPQIPEMDHNRRETHPIPKIAHRSIHSSEERATNDEFALSSDDRQQNLRTPKRRRMLTGNKEQIHQKDGVFSSATRCQSPKRPHNVLGAFDIQSNPESESSVRSRLSLTETKGTRRDLEIPAQPDSISQKLSAGYRVSSKTSDVKFDPGGLELTTPSLRPDYPYRERSSNMDFKDIGPVDGHSGPQRQLSDLTCSENSELDKYHSLTPMPSADIVTEPREGSSTRRRLVDSLGIHDPRWRDPSADSDENDQLPTSSQADDADMASDDFLTESRRILHQPLESRHKKADRIANTNLSSRSGGSKITYARQRSFLSNIDISEDTQAELPQPIYGRLEPANSTPSIGSDEISGLGSVRSIHELRQAGGNARFQGIVDSIFEDVEDAANSVSARRDGLIQLCEKLSDRQFARRFVESGSFRRLASCITPQLDAISSYLVICAYGLILCIGAVPSTVTMTFWPRILTMIPSLLAMDEDISTLVAQRRYGLSRANQAAIRDLSSHLRKSTVLTDQLPSWLSPQRMLLRSMQLTTRKFRERGEIADILPDVAVSELTQLLLKHSLLAKDLDSISKDVLILESTLSILEAHTTLSSSIGDDHQNALKPLAQTSHLLSSLGVLKEGRSKQLLILHLRLILNVTNNNPSLCEDFANTELVRGLVEIVLTNFQMASGDFIGEKKDSLDIVILALGALINLTEESETSRKIIFTLEIDSRSLLEHLLHLFSVGLETISEADSVVQTHSNVAFGYLSILLCTLCLDMEIRSCLSISLGGTGLARVLATVDEFLHYHRKVDEELHQSQSEKDPLIEFTSRLQGILSQIRGTEAGV
ncbi:hypothetical protein VTN77DRAFT_921 [Rasamsonia byssochlamydoides]|uniref:uncharacterized protein n=1 Tax=Rasamsonia byssochlamydoides TaxID=89139 RepID=UPI003743B53F